MRKIFFGRNTVEKEGTIDYFLLVEELEEPLVEHYGIQVKKGNEEASIRRITVSQKGILTLLSAMLRLTVTPVAARDVVEDWLLI